MGKRLLFALWIAAAGLGHPASDGLRTESARVKTTVLEAQIATKRAVLKQAWAELARLDALAPQSVPHQPDSPQPLPEEASAGAEKVRGLLDLSFQRESVERQRQATLKTLQDAYQEILHLESEIRKIRAQQGRKPLLEGRWILTLMPQGAKGEVFMTQNGTLLSGDYQLESGLSGNLQGTVVNDQVALERIDSRYGRMGRFEGQVSKEGRRVQGSWYSYDVQSGEPLTGPFLLERAREETGPEE